MGNNESSKIAKEGSTIGNDSEENKMKGSSVSSKAIVKEKGERAVEMGLRGALASVLSLNEGMGGIENSQNLPPQIREMAGRLHWNLDGIHGIYHVHDNNVYEFDEQVRIRFGQELNLLERFLKDNNLEQYIPAFKEMRITITDLELFDPVENDEMIRTKLIPNEEDRARFYKALESFEGRKKDERERGDEFWIDPKLVIIGEIFREGPSGGNFRRGILRVHYLKLPVEILEVEPRNEEEETIMVDKWKRISQLSHPNILQCLGAFKVEKKVCFVFETCNEGYLKTFLSNYKSPAPKEEIHPEDMEEEEEKETNDDNMIPLLTKMKLIYQISLGMAYLHRDKIILEDLNTSTIRLIRKKVKKEYSEASEYLVKISFFPPPKPFPESTAPEFVLDADTYDTRANIPEEEMVLTNIYSFGILMWEVLTQKIAFEELRKEYKNDLEFLKKIHTKSERPSIEDPVLLKLLLPVDLLELVTSCWDEDPEARPDSFELVLMELDEVFDHMMNHGLINLSDQ